MPHGLVHILLLLLICCGTCFVDCKSSFELPILPSALPNINELTLLQNKRIPQIIWQAVKDNSSSTLPHLIDLYKRNPLWKHFQCDNDCKDKFISTVFRNTSLERAYFLINPEIGAARADVWRYAVLYTHGGAYLDDDSDIGTPFDSIISEDDHFIVSEEGKSSLGPCFTRQYYLSDHYMNKTYSHNASTAKHFYQYDPITGLPLFFHGNTLLNWAMFVRPRHPLLLIVLEAIVDIIKNLYFGKQVVHLGRHDHRWKLFFCTTTFTLTYSLQLLLLQNRTDIEIPRIVGNNFAQYKGKVKVFSTGNDPMHYSKKMKGKHPIPFLLESCPKIV